MESSNLQSPIDSADQGPSVNPPLAYAGFWIRVLAAVLDSLLLLMVMVPLLLVFYGPGVFFATQSPGLVYDLINYALPLLAVMVFWQYRSATPGKIMMGLVIVDAKTLGKPGFGKLLLRYLGYYVSTIPLLLGLIWVGIDKRKQGWHDKIAGTLVLKTDGKEQAPFASDKGNNISGMPDGKGIPRYKEPAETKKHDPWTE